MKTLDHSRDAIRDEISSQVAEWLKTHKVTILPAPGSGHRLDHESKYVAELKQKGRNGLKSQHGRGKKFSIRGEE